MTSRCHPSVVLFFLPVLLSGQTLAPTAPAKSIALPAIATDPILPSAPTYSLSVAWNSRTSDLLTVPLNNDTSRALHVLGVQGTRGIFVSDYPATVAAKKSENIAFIYEPADNADGDVEVIRALTDQGVKEIHVQIARAAAAKSDAREVRWTAGGVADTKTVTLTVTPGTVIPLRVRPAGGHQATLEAVNATTWKVKITPSSTTHSGQFPIYVDFDRPLPGAAVVILGVIQPKE